jgi:hypothetical protein
MSAAIPPGTVDVAPGMIEYSKVAVVSGAIVPVRVYMLPGVSVAV